MIPPCEIMVWKKRKCGKDTDSKMEKIISLTNVTDRRALFDSMEDLGPRRSIGWIFPDQGERFLQGISKGIRIPIHCATGKDRPIPIDHRGGPKLSARRRLFLLLLIQIKGAVLGISRNPFLIPF